MPNWVIYILIVGCFVELPLPGLGGILITPIKLGSLIAIFFLYVHRCITGQFNQLRLNSFDKYLVFQSLLILAGLFVVVDPVKFKSLFRAYISVYLLYILMLNIGRKDRLRGLLWAFCIGVFISSALGVLQALTGMGISSAVNARSRGLMYGFHRALGFTEDPNYYAQMLLMTLPICFYLYKTSAAHSMARRLAIGSFLIGSLGMFLSFSRMGLLGYAFILLYLLAQSPRKKQLVLVLSFMTLILLPILGPALFQRLYSVYAFLAYGQILDASVGERSHLISASLQLFQQYPIFGVGLGNYGEHIFHFLPDHLTARYAHNSYLTILTEHGLIGLSFYLLFLFKIYRYILQIQDIELKRAFRYGFFCYLFCNLFLVSTTLNIFWAFLSVVILYAHHQTRQPEFQQQLQPAT